MVRFACSHIGELESADSHAARGEKFGDLSHERAGHGCAGAVGQKEAGEGRFYFRMVMKQVDWRCWVHEL